MKHLLMAFLVSIIFLLTAQAQNSQTLFNKLGSSLEGTMTEFDNLSESRAVLASNNETWASPRFGGPYLTVSSLDNNAAVMLGGVTGVRLKNWSLGVYGQWMVSGIRRNVEGKENLKLNFGHGGLWVGYDHQPDKHIHFVSNLQIGWGRARFRDTQAKEIAFQDQNLLVLTPEIGVEINVIDFMSLRISGGYRWVGGNTLIGLETGNLNSWTIKVMTFFRWSDQD